MMKCMTELLVIGSCENLLSILYQVGIIMYLPTPDARQRKEITEEFFHYRRLTQSQLWDQYSAFEHWAKIEACISPFRLEIF